MSLDIRRTAREKFVQANLGDVMLQPLKQDASFRRYFRVIGAKRPLLLMDAPPEQENVDAFLHIANALEMLKLRPPRIQVSDVTNGFVLLEDLGEDTFTRLLANGANEQTLYAAAIDILIKLHHNADAGQVDAPAYNIETLQNEVSLFVDWYAPAQGLEISGQQRTEFLQAFGEVLDKLPTYKPTLVLRDFHVDNLMRIKAGENHEYALLDFQSALIGHPAYDVMSLLEDARRDIDPILVSKMLARYFAAVPANNSNAFRDWYSVLAMQRHLKVAGIFVRLNMRDGKPQYLKHIPRVIKLAAKHIGNPSLKPVSNWLKMYFPNWQTPRL